MITIGLLDLPPNLETEPMLELAKPEPSPRPWIIEAIANPCPEAWPGRWYSFRRVDGTEDGYAHESKLSLYVGLEAADGALNG
jgi:hypothetical protein